MLTPVRADAYTRRQVLVDRRFQLKYVAGLAAGGACMCAAFGGAVWLAVRQARESLGPEAQSLLEGTETTVLILTLLMAVLMALAMALVALLVTHRIAGPVRVLRRQFRYLAEGRYPRWRPLRNHDELRELFAEFHAAVDAVRRREHEELAALEAGLATGNPTAGTTLAALAAKKRAGLDASDEES